MYLGRNVTKTRLCVSLSSCGRELSSLQLTRQNREGIACACRKPFPLHYEKVTGVGERERGRCKQSIHELAHNKGRNSPRFPVDSATWARGRGSALWKGLDTLAKHVERSPIKAANPACHRGVHEAHSDY